MKVGGVTLKEVAKRFMGVLVRDMTADTGDVATTGVGFTPNLIIATSMLIGNISLAKCFSQGIWTVNAGSANYRTWLSNPSSGSPGYMNLGNDVLVYLDEATGKSQKAIVKSVDADGFTLTWTREGAPTAGNGYVYYLALRL